MDSSDKMLVRELVLTARDMGRYQEACFYIKRKVWIEPFDIWFEREWEKLITKINNERQSSSS